MSANEIWQQFISDMAHTTWYEYVAVFAGIASVWFSKIENILVYPVGLVNTIIYIYISFEGHLPGEASVNFYYTVMSIYGWFMWSKKDRQHHPIVVITNSGLREWGNHLLFFFAFYVALFVSLTYLKKDFAPGAIPWADAFASATAYTGMWLMTKKKVESWHWWLMTNIASVPLYFVKHYVFTSVYYIVLLIINIFGLIEWQRRARAERQKASLVLQ
jgi:nicotinamide mononucleotide transporter